MLTDQTLLTQPAARRPRQIELDLQKLIAACWAEPNPFEKLVEAIYFVAIDDERRRARRRVRKPTANQRRAA
jgi:hypothetical protein